MEREEIIKLTEEYGGQWGINHAKRLLHLISIIGEGIEYNKDAIWLAAYLHDWGGYSKWMVPGVEHYDRSREVAEQFLAENGFDLELSKLVLEIIANHHGGSPDRSIESILFTDADALDLLGSIGALRCFAMAPRDLHLGLQIAKKYRELGSRIILLEKSKQMAQERMQEMDRILAEFGDESFGYL